MFLDRTQRALLLQRLFWSRLGVHAVKRIVAFEKRWDAVVLNRSGAAEVNGEHWLTELLPQTPFVVDAGFHRGAFAQRVLLARPAGRVLGFEPASSMRTIYDQTHAPDPRISVEPFALSNAEGEAEFHDDASGSSSIAPIEHSERTVTYTIKTTTLDAFAASVPFEHVDLLKIDVEGYDLHVLEGANALLTSQAIDIFLFEYNAPWILTRRYLRDAWQYLSSKPYQLFRLYNGFLAPFEYDYAAERFDLGVMYVGISKKRLAQGNVPIRWFPT